MATSLPDNPDLPPGMRRGRNLQVVGERQQQPTQNSTTSSTSEAAYLAATKAAREKEAEFQAALATVKAAYAILGTRAQLILSGLGSAAFFGWAVYSTSGIALLGAVSYTVLVFLPSLYASRQA